MPAAIASFFVSSLSSTRGYKRRGLSRMIRSALRSFSPSSPALRSSLRFLSSTSAADQRFETRQLGQAEAVVKAEKQYHRERDQQHLREGENEELQPLQGHDEESEHRDEHDADAGPHCIARAALLPHDRHALDGHRNDHHREQRDGEPGF